MKASTIAAWAVATVNDQESANALIPALLESFSAHVVHVTRGPVNLEEWIGPAQHCGACGETYFGPVGDDRCGLCGEEYHLITTWGTEQREAYQLGYRDPGALNGDGPPIHRVIVEAGPWAADIVEQCRAARVYVYLEAGPGAIPEATR